MKVSSEQFRLWMREMPKVELHTHVEGAVRPETILDLADQYHLPLPAADEQELHSKIGMRPGEDLSAFLKKFDHYRFVFDQPESLRRLAYEAIEDNAKENILYTELRINPRKNLEKLSIGQVLDATLEGMQQASQDFGVEARLIASINRSYPLESAMEVAQAAALRQGQGVVGLDLAGDEVHHPASKFKEVFEFAKSQGLNVTIHAGEAMGPESIRQAIEDCQADRIGHGVRIGEDPQVVQLARDRGVVLEMCPTSNRLLNITPDLSQYPLKHYQQQGLITTVNTDDRHIFGTTLSDEYYLLAEHSGLGLQELQGLARQGMEAAFLPQAERAAIGDNYRAALEQFSRRLPSQAYVISQQGSPTPQATIQD